MKINNSTIQLKACIFDLDGVLVDTAIYHYKAWKKMANQLGFDFTEKQNESLKGISRDESLKLILEWGGLSIPPHTMAELAEQKNNWYTAMISTMTPQEVLPGAIALLTAVRENGIKTALGSVSKNAGLILEHTGLARFFDAIVDGNMGLTSKPDPAVFLKGAELLQEAPVNCLVFEDAVAGVKAALTAGMKVIGVGEEAVLKDADLVVKDLSEITLEEIRNHYHIIAADSLS
ncbi:beta-phosphoglucomutase [Chitinophaga sp. MM2321]|uniref:beta-phosphoglucomutase n=1 Tax=Chitinophaga sp. MM2321 TaxID=3137178 RepID=UPI0032D56B1F